MWDSNHVSTESALVSLLDSHQIIWEREVRDNSPKTVMTNLAVALRRLKEVFPAHDLAQEKLGHELVRPFIGQYGVRFDELNYMGLSFGSTVSSAIAMLEEKLQQQAA